MAQDTQHSSFDLQKRGRVANLPPDLWTKCKSCGESIYTRSLEDCLYVCPHCGFYHPMTAWQRIRLLTDDTHRGFTETNAGLISCDPLHFNNGAYADKLLESRQITGLNEAVVTGKAYLDGQRYGLAVMDFRFMGASMGSAVGEKITRLCEWTTKRELPLVIVTASGGARMQEGALSLMQMAKTSGAIMRHDEAGLPLIIILTHPTTGGVTASFASLGDVILAEPNALIGFAGPRVIEQTTHQKLPPNFQRAEYLLAHGFVDAIVERQQLRMTLSNLLRIFER